MIPFDEALARLIGSAVTVGPERVGLDDTIDRVLAEDIVARSPLPPFDYSAMDGYAVAADDFTGDGPWDLPVRGESAAGGDLPSFTRGTACRIYTGARAPEGADAIVMQEIVERRGDVARFTQRPKAGAHMRRRGEDMREGAVAITRGSRMTPGKIALAAALDRPTVLVARRPVVTVLCSGDELRSPGDPGKPGSVPESNGYFVAAAARRAGAVARVAAFVRDDAEASRIAVEDALRGSDLVVTIGGVSVGDRDVVKPALEAAGVVIDFWRVKIKPGKPLAVGRKGPIHVIGLPGNPASASLTFLLFGVPLIRAMQGDTSPYAPRMELSVTPGVKREPGRQEFLRARLVHGMVERYGEGGDHLYAKVFTNQASGAVTSFAEADALVVVPAEHGEVIDGERFEVIRIADM